MFDRIRSFLRLRKQNDTVKIMCIFALAGIAAFASVLYHAWEIYDYVNTSAGYVLTGEGRSRKSGWMNCVRVSGWQRSAAKWSVPSR